LFFICIFYTCKNLSVFSSAPANSKGSVAPVLFSSDFYSLLIRKAGEGGDHTFSFQSCLPSSLAAFLEGLPPAVRSRVANSKV